MNPTMGALQHVEWEACLVAPTRDAALERQIRRSLGIIPDWMPFFFVCPWVIDSDLDFTRLKLVHFDLELAQMVALVVSQDNSCRYCYAANRAQLRALGIPEERIGKLEENLLTADLGAPEKQALDFVRRVSRSSPMPGEDDLKALRQAGYEEAAIRELAFLASMHVFFNRLTTLPALPPERAEGLTGTWSFRLFGPLLGRLLRFQQKRARGRTLPPDAASGPFSHVVQSLEGLPAAVFLHDLISHAWQSPILSRRTKGLIFAVIARALDCPLSEREAVRLLGAEGLEADDVLQILAHLSSPKLDVIEAAVVPFARDTVRYRPTQIQRLGRTLREQLTQPQFLEVVGIAGLANAICRLSLLSK